ncbi:MAG: hypothetical protein ABH832_00720 [bacterium]
MIKKIISVVMFISMGFLCAGSVLAVEDFGAGVTASKAGYSSQTGDIYVLINKIVGSGLSLIAIVFFGIMMYAGLRWMTARGNDEISQKAKTALTASIIGLIITISAYAISSFIFGRLVGSS